MLIKDIEGYSLDDHAYKNDAYSCMNNSDKKQFFIDCFKESTSNNVLYVHIPYCLSKCKYCIYQSEKLSSKELLEQHIRELIPCQIEQYQEIFDSVSFDQVYFGGGTPTIVCPDLMDLLFRNIPNFKDIPKKCIETSPSTIDLGHVKLFSSYNFSFVSIGVQTLSERICKKWNRPYISNIELLRIAECMHQHDLYFNFDLICFLDKKDIRDLLEFRQHLEFIVKECRPSSITIHQLVQSQYSDERTRALIKTLRNILKEHPSYVCANSLLNDKDASMDTLYNSEYRLVLDGTFFTHYMWGKNSRLPVEGYNILSLGYTKKFQTTSNVDNLLYIPSNSILRDIEYDKYISTDSRNIQKTLAAEAAIGHPCETELSNLKLHARVIK